MRVERDALALPARPRVSDCNPGQFGGGGSGEGGGKVGAELVQHHSHIRGEFGGLLLGGVLGSRVGADLHVSGHSGRRDGALSCSLSGAAELGLIKLGTGIPNLII